MYKKDSELIEKVQRRATKLLPELKNLDYSTRLRKLNLPSLVYRRERAYVLQIYRIIHGIDQIDCNMFFELEEGTITRGHSLKIKKVRVNNRRRQCALGVRAINNWNSLTDNIVLSGNINLFKTRLERFWSGKESKFDPTGYHGLIV